MDEEMIKCLINKYLNGTATACEITELDKWYDAFDTKSDLYSSDAKELHAEMEKNLTELKSKMGLR